MVNMDPLFFSSVKEEDDTKPMNPNDLLLSMFANITGPLLQDNSTPPDAETVNTAELAESILRSILSKPANSTANIMKQECLVEEYDQKEADRDLSSASPSLSALNPALASALSGMMHPRADNNMANGKSSLLPSMSYRAMRSVFGENIPLSRRLSGPVRLEGPVVPLHLQRHADGQMDLPSSHTVSYNGRQEEVPDEILCHLCNFPMKMCYRKSKYKQEIREYPAYRCLRKGCQTFRAIRKVLDEDAIPLEAKRKAADPNKTLKDLLSAPSSNLEVRPPPTKIRKDNRNGTLVYIPFALNPAQVQRLQEAAKEIVTQEKLLEEGEVFIPPLMVTTPLMEEEVLEKLKTEDGIKEIKEQLLTSRQMPRHLLQPSGDSSPEQAVPC